MRDTNQSLSFVDLSVGRPIVCTGAGELVWGNEQAGSANNKVGVGGQDFENHQEFMSIPRIVGLLCLIEYLSIDCGLTHSLSSPFSPDSLHHVPTMTCPYASPFFDSMLVDTQTDNIAFDIYGSYAYSARQ